MSDNERFDGRGYSREEFTEEERSGHRQMMAWIGERRSTIEGMHNLVQGGKTAKTILIALAVFGAALGWASSQGWF